MLTLIRQKNKAIYLGLIIVLVGVIIKIAGTAIAAAATQAVGHTTAATSVILDFVITLITVGVVPIGAALMAIGIFLSLVERSQTTRTPDSGHQDAR